MREIPAKQEISGPSIEALNAKLSNIEERALNIRNRLEDIYDISPNIRADKDKVKMSGPSI